MVGRRSRKQHGLATDLVDLRRPELLDTGRHDRRSFDSGEPELDDWLRRYAGQNRRGNTAATWVIADADDLVVAYATLSMTSVDHAAAPRPLTRNAPNPTPALLLGRLAVDRRYTGLGVGRALVMHVMAMAEELNAKAACRAIVVTALNKQARSWWQHLGFTPFDEDESCLDLYLLIADIAETFRQLAQRD